MATRTHALLGANMAFYAFIAEDLHLLLLASFPEHYAFFLIAKERKVKNLLMLRVITCKQNLSP